MPIHGIVAILCATGLVVGVGSVFSGSKRGIVEWVVRGTCYIPGKPYPTLLLVGFVHSLPFFQLLTAPTPSPLSLSWPSSGAVVVHSHCGYMRHWSHWTHWIS